MSLNFEGIFQTQELIAEKVVERAHFDRTITATIVNCEDPKIGKYKVRHEDSLIYAYATNLDVEYQPKDEVFILVQGGELGNKKIILGTTPETAAASPSYIMSEEEKYEFVGSNVFPSNSIFRFRSYDASKNNETSQRVETILYQASGGDFPISYKANAAPNPGTFSLDIESFKKYLEIGKYLIIKATIANNFKKEQINSGNYGIQIDLKYNVLSKESAEQQTTICSYIFDVSSMEGHPWIFGGNEVIGGSAQFSPYPLPENGTFIEVDKIVLFAEKFNQGTNSESAQDVEWDLWIKDLNISVANRIPDTDLNASFLRFITPYGTVFSDKSLDNEIKEIQTQVFEKGRDISSLGDIEYYWFYKRADVDTQHENYCYYGGEGWYCLNDKYEADSTEIELARKWKPASNIHKVGISVPKEGSDSEQDIDIVYRQKEDGVEQSYILTQSKVYKCVVVKSDSSILEKEISLFRTNTDWSVTIDTEPAGERSFYKNEQDVTIFCSVWDGQDPIVIPENSSEENKETLLKCKWAYKDHLGRVVLLPKEEKLRLTIQPKDIEYQRTYICSVFLSDGNFIGSDQITLTSLGEDLNVPRYELFVENSSQIFLYNESGLSPADNSYSKPQAILPLKLSVFDSKTKQLKNLAETSAAIQIFVPIDSLIKVANYSSSTSEEYIYNYNTDSSSTINGFPKEGFSFGISQRYSSNKKKNTIRIEVLYNKIKLVAYTNFLFTKQGEDGTNGTDFVCRIVPNYNDTTQNKYYEWISWTNNQDGTRSYNFNGNGFIVELTETGKIIEGIEIKEWSALARKYTSSISEHSLIVAGAQPGYLPPSDSVPNSSILQAEIRYEGNTYYASLPIVDIRRKSFIHNFEVKGGFRDVIYKADGTSPQYDPEPFSIVVTEITDAEGIQDVTKDVNYQWSVLGKIYETRDNKLDWFEAELLKPDTLVGNNFLVKPASKYDGLCLSTGVQCVVSKDSIELATIFIPIHFYLNRFGHAAINGWNGNDIVTDNEAGIILSPQFGAGEKDINNRFTGLVMGAIKDNDNKKKIGLVGYGKGVESLFINAQDGSASFGAKGKGQILIKPNTLDSQGQVVSGDAIIEGGEYDTGSGKGLQINLSKPSITYGSGKFKVDEDGILTAKGAKIEGSFQANGELGDVFQVKVPYYDDNGYLKYTQINFSDGSANISGNRLNINFNTGRLSFNDEEEDTSSFTGYIQPSGFYFGSEYVENSDGSKKGGSIRYSDGMLSISGSFNAETGKIGGWNIADKELYSSGKAIRLYSGDEETDPENPIPAFISIKDSDGEFSVSSGSQKVALRKGGMYLYSESFALDDDDKKEKLSNWYGRIYANDNSDSLSISTQEKRPIIFWGANISVPDEDGQDIEEDRVLMCMRPGDSKAEDYIQIGAKKTGETSTYTRLYYNGIHVKDITPYKKMDTKATTIVDAINEIYPGGPLNIQHAVAVLPENKLDILYDYTIITHTHSAEVGYGPYQNVIYAQGYKMTDFPKPGASASNLTADFNDFKRKYPNTEFYNAISGKFFCLQQKTFVEDENADIGFDEYSSLVTGVASVFHETSNQGAYRDHRGTLYWEDNHRTTYLLKADGINITKPSDQGYLFFTSGSSLMLNDGKLTTSSQFALIWDKIYSPGAGVGKYDLGYGYIEGSINTFSVRQRLTTSNATWVFGGGDQPATNWHYSSSFYYYNHNGVGTAPIRIPFTSQAEYDAAVNLLATDARLYELYEVQQNKRTG